MRRCAQGTAGGRDYAFSYRAVAADGRVRWLHDVVHVVNDPDGTPRELQGVMIDITAQKRRERASALLAEAGRLLAGVRAVEDTLTAVAELAVGELGDRAAVFLRGGDGRFRPMAAAPPAAAAGLLALASVTISQRLEAAQRAGRAVVVPEINDELLRAATVDDATAYTAFRTLGIRSALIVPLLTGEQVVGCLAIVATESVRHYDEQDVALAEDLGRRIAAMVGTGQIANRQRQLQQITAALASADSLQAVAEALVAGVRDAFAACAQSVYAARPGGRLLEVVHAVGDPTDPVGQFSRLRIEDPVPIAAAAKTGEPVWLHGPADWTARYPHLAEHARTRGHHAAVALPLRVAGRVVGVLAASFPTPREFPPDERDFALTLVGQAAQAFQRAVDADQRRSAAETLQHALLPPTLPDLDRLGLAAEYLPAACGIEAGGDWYDVLPLDAHRVAVAIGDVVGQGAAAAAVMGQLRSALSAYLLDGHGPSASLQRLDRFARRVEGALGSTAVCLMIDTQSGELSWARAGHPPPLVLSSTGAAYLDDARGSLLGLPHPPRFTEGRTLLSPGSTVLLFTDGLIERRGEVIDDGLTRLAAAAAPHATATPTQLIQAAMGGALQGTSPTDDVAVIAARLRPGVLQRRLPATPTQLPKIRRIVSAWATAIPVPDDQAEDLQLALGEAAANAVEHAYAGQTPGAFGFRIAHDRDGSIQVTVDDDGTWRPVPADPGFRGRGLAMIRAIGQDVVVDTQGKGTHVRFTLPPPPPDRPREGPGAALRHHPTIPRQPAELRAHREPSGALRLQLCGELDLSTIGTLRAALLEHLQTSAGPIILDTREVTYLSSAGVGLLLEAMQSAPGRLQLPTDPGSATAQILTLTGLDRHLIDPPPR